MCLANAYIAPQFQHPCTTKEIPRFQGCANRVNTANALASLPMFTVYYGCMVVVVVKTLITGRSEAIPGLACRQFSAINPCYGS